MIVDEVSSGNRLIDLLNKNFSLFHRISLESGKETALYHAIQNKPELMFINIGHLGPELDDFVSTLKSSYIPGIICIAENRDLVIKAFEINAIDCLLMPVKTSHLTQALLKLSRLLPTHSSHNNQRTASQTISIFDGNDYIFRKTLDIVRIEAHGSYSKIFSTIASPQLVTKNLKFFEKALKNQGFFRCHKSHLINKEHVHRYNRNDSVLTLTSGQVVHISKSYKAMVNNILLGL